MSRKNVKDSINECDHELNKESEKGGGTKDDLVVVGEWRERRLRNR